MIVSVYFAKDRNETWAFVGDYDEVREPDSYRNIRFSSGGAAPPVVILHGSAKDKLKKVCESNSKNEEIGHELDNLAGYVMTRLRCCGIPDVERADIRLFVHFGSQSRQDVKKINEKFVGRGKSANFQCFAVSRHHRMPRRLYPDGDRIVPPRSEDDINRMCGELGGAGDEPGHDSESIRTFSILCQALAMLPEAERQKYLKGEAAEKWWKKNWSKLQKNTVPVTRVIKKAVSDISAETQSDKTTTGNDFDISNLNFGLIAEIAAQKLRENQL